MLTTSKNHLLNVLRERGFSVEFLGEQDCWAVNPGATQVVLGLPDDEVHVSVSGEEAVGLFDDDTPQDAARLSLFVEQFVAAVDSTIERGGGRVDVTNRAVERHLRREGPVDGHSNGFEWRARPPRGR